MRTLPFLQIFLLLCLLFVGSSCAFAAGKTYVLSYSPGTYVHTLARDRIKVAYKKAGLKAEFIPLPHNRSLISANAGTVDGDVGRVASIEEKYPELRRVNVKVMAIRGAAYTVDPAIKTYDESTLRKYRVGYVLGVRWQQQKMAGINSTTVADYPALFEMLLQKRVDIVLATEASAAAEMAKFGSRAKEIRKLQPTVFTAPIYHYVNKKNSDIIPLLEQAIREINAEERLIFYTGVQSPLLEILQKRLQEAFTRIGRVCEVRSTGSPPRALLMANEQGAGDALRSQDIKRLAPDMTVNLLRVPESITEIVLHAYSSGDMFPTPGWSSLEGRKNGMRVGAVILEKNIPGNKTLLPDSDRLFQMLAVKRLDTVSENSDIADFLIQKKHLFGIKKLHPALASFPGYCYVHKRHKALIPLISASLAEMKWDGSFDRIKQETIAQLLGE